MRLLRPPAYGASILSIASSPELLVFINTNLRPTPPLQIAYKVTQISRISVMHDSDQFIDWQMQHS